jgi:hypothetical protein
MSVTVAQVAKAALQAILVQASEAPLEADEYQDFIFAMNNYMASLAAKGVNLGYTAVSDLGDTVTIPPGALTGLIANMAIQSVPYYGGMVTPELALTAREGMQAMRQLGQVITPTRLPSTLPIGSGNEDTGFGRNWHFYPGSDTEVLTEITGAIAVEISTNG